jgi:hypothetical protein
MVHTVIYSRPFPPAKQVEKDAPVCLAMLPRDGKVPFGCTRERGHDGHHEAASLNGRTKLAEWSDE